MRNYKFFIFMLTICIMVPMTVIPGVAAGASGNFIGPAPEFSEAPEHIYEISKPSADIAIKNTYSPEFGGAAAQGAPVISGITHSAAPNESIVIEGRGLEAADIYIYGINQNGAGVYEKAELISCKDTTVTVIINGSFAPGMFLIWAKNKSGTSYPVRVNAPRATYVSEENPQAGDMLSIYGENLLLEEGEKPGIYFVSGDKAISIPISTAEPYQLTFEIPDTVSAGSYKVYVHNGSGGDYGWSLPLEIKVTEKSTRWSGKTITVDGYTDGAIQDAIGRADDYDIIYFKNGTYIVDAQIMVNKKLKFVGESKSGVKIVCGLDKEGNMNKNYAFLITGYPSEFSNLTFEDDSDKALSPVFIWANAYSVSGSRESFVVDNCYFGKNHTFGTKTVKSSEQVGKCISVSTVTGVKITNNTFVAPSAAFITTSDNIDVSGNTAYGTWINDGENGACFMQFTSCNNVAIYENGIYGQDIISDPAGTLEEGDRTFCRVLAFQLPYGGTRNVYIADNEFDRVGGFIGNSGELIMFEAINKLGEFKPRSVNGKTLSFSGTTWSAAESGEMKVGTKPVLGATVIISNGKGNAQYRRIAAVTEDSVTVDRAWDILPDTDSTVCIVTPMENVVVYNNSMTGPDKYYTQYNATAGIQAYANMLNFHVKNNTIENVMTGIRLSSHYYMVGDSHFAVFEDTIVEDNRIDNVRYGIMMLFAFKNDNNVFKETEPVIHASHNTIIRTNQISNTRYSTASNLNGIGGDGITVGSEYKSYATWSPTKIYNGDWVTNTVVEKNMFSGIASCSIRMQYHQGNTILRDNKYDSAAVAVGYDVSSVCKVILPIEYTSQNVEQNAQEENEVGYIERGPAEQTEAGKMEESEKDISGSRMKYLLVGEIALFAGIILMIFILLFYKRLRRK